MHRLFKDLKLRALGRRKPEKIKISNDLLAVKDLIGKPRRNFNESITIKAQLEELGHKVDDIGKRINGKGSFDLKKVKEIIFLLKNKEMTSADAGKLLKLSRNRMNEYLKKLEKEGILESRVVAKKKYYKIIEKPTLAAAKRGNSFLERRGI